MPFGEPVRLPGQQKFVEAPYYTPVKMAARFEMLESKSDTL
jgi:hypothetical protein